MQLWSKFEGHYHYQLLRKSMGKNVELNAIVNQEDRLRVPDSRLPDSRLPDSRLLSIQARNLQYENIVQLRLPFIEFSNSDLDLSPRIHKTHTFLRQLKILNILQCFYFL